MSIKPRVFIASSVEGLEVAYKIQDLLDYSAECTVWDQDVFKPSSSTMSDLFARAHVSDYGIFVFSFEDDIKIRGEDKLTVRDNVLLEFGIFAGTIGISNCFIVMPRDSNKFHFTSDLLGVTTLKYNSNRQDNNLKAALGPAVSRIRDQIQNFVPTKQISTQLIQQIEKVGLNSFFANRDDYGKYRVSASTIDKYINTAQKSIVIVGISLSTGIQFDNICKCIEKRLNQSTDFKVTVSLLDPMQNGLYQSICEVFDCDYPELQAQTKRALKMLSRVKAKLLPNAQERFVIKVHKSIPFASAIMLDDDIETGRIQIETKPYKAGMRDSFALEFNNNGNGFYNTLRSSYHNLIDDAVDID